MRGDYERGRELLEESLEISRKAGDKVMMAEALIQLAGTAWGQGDAARANEIYQEGIDLCREAGYTYRLPDFLFSLGYQLLLEGDYERGAALNAEAAALSREHGYKRSLDFALDNQGWAACSRVTTNGPEASTEESLVVCKELGDKAAPRRASMGWRASPDQEDRPRVGHALRGGSGDYARRWAKRLLPAHPRVLSWRELTRPPPARGSGAGVEETLEKGRAMGLEERSSTPPRPRNPPRSSPPPRPSFRPGITSREAEVLGLVATGMTTPRSAERLFLSPATVQRHLNSVYHKLGVGSRTAATRFALEHGLA